MSYPIRILIVDDDPTVVASYESILASSPCDEVLSRGRELFHESAPASSRPPPLAYELVKCRDGEQGVAAVRDSIAGGRPIAVAFLDLILPGMGGAELARHIWRVDPRVKIVLVTAHVGKKAEELIETALREDLFLLHKPFHPEEVRQFARALGGQWAMERDRRDLVDKNDRLLRMLSHMEKYRSLNTMAAGIIQQFSNLFTPVQGYIQLVLDDLSPGDPLSAYLDSSLESLRRAIQMVRLLHLYLGQGTKAPNDFLLADQVERLARKLSGIMPGYITLKLSLHESATITMDAEDLDHMLNVLVSNAVEAIGTIPGEICIRTGMAFYPSNKLAESPWTVGLKESWYAFIEVTDTGSGIDAHNFDCIFEPFFSTKFLGRGMGLPSLLGLVRANRGGVVVKSFPGRGAVFRLIVPMSPASPGVLQEEEEELVVRGELDGKISEHGSVATTIG